MGADPKLVKQITDNLEKTYTNLRHAASNISGLLNVGRATCDEVRAYNLWALSVYNSQRGMLATLRNAGENVPTLPTYPTLFAWRGVAGSSAVNIDCSGQESSLNGTMRRALKGPDEKSVFLSSNDIEVVTTNQYDYDPTQAPSLASLAKRDAQLGIAPIVVLIVAGLSVAVYFAIDALAAYLTESDIQRETTERTAIQSQAFATYTAARLKCYSDCTAGGGAHESCIDTCARLVTKPEIKIDALRAVKDWGIFQWIGFAAVVGAVAIAGWKIREKRQRGERLLPDWAQLPG